MEINQNVFGTDEHLSIANTLKNIADVYQDMGRHEDALSNYKKSLKIFRNIFGNEEHSSIIDALKKIVLVNSKLEKLKETIEIC